MTRARSPQPHRTRRRTIARAAHIATVAIASSMWIALASSVWLGCAPAAPPESVIVAVPMVPTSTAPAPVIEAPPLCPSGMTFVAGGKLVRGGRESKVGDLCLDTTEVTSAAYGQCVDRGACDGDELTCDEAPTYKQADLANHPINCVSFSQAERYCRAQNKRLPTLGEWEWAAGGREERRRFSWGDDPPAPDALCWSKSIPRAGTCAVGAFPASRTPQGIDDLFGGVWEWLAPESQSGPPNIARGGSWQNDTLDMLEGDNAGYFLPGFVRNDVVGFRCAADPTSR